MDSIGRAPSKPLTQARLRMFTTSWRFWVLPILYSELGSLKLANLVLTWTDDQRFGITVEAQAPSCRSG